MLRKLFAVGTGVAMLLLGTTVPAFANNSGSHSSLSEQDRDFLQMAAQGNIFEITGGVMAVARAQTPEGTLLGTKLATDHTLSLALLAVLASQYNVKLPTHMSDKQADELADVRAAKGVQFDDEYAELEVQDHKQDIRDFTKEVTNGRNTDVRAFAAASLPMLQDHLAMSVTTTAAVETALGH